MSRLSAPARSRVLIALAAVLLAVVAVGVVALGLRNFVREVVVQPVAYIAWYVGLVIRSIPQSAFWGLLVAVAVLAAWRSLGPARIRFAQRRARGPVIPDQPDRSRLAAVYADLARMRESGFAREKVAFDLRALMVRALAYRESEPVERVERRIRDGTLEVPPDIRMLLTDWQHWLAGPPGGPLARGWRRVLALLDAQRSRDTSDAGASYETREARLTAAIAYMEQIVGGPVPPGYPSKEQHD